MTAREPADLSAAIPPSDAGSTGSDAPAGSDATARSDAAARPDVVAGPVRGRLLRAIAVYSLLRLALLAVLTVVLLPFVPLLIALILAIVLQLPIAVVAFRGPRAELTAAWTEKHGQRRAERDTLRAQLRGSA